AGEVARDGRGPGARRALRRGRALRGAERPGLDEHAAAALPHRLLAGGTPRGHDGARRNRGTGRRVEVARDPRSRGLLRIGGSLAQVTRLLLPGRTALLAAGLLVLGFPGTSRGATTRPARAPVKAREAPAPIRPDAALFAEAKQARAALE